MRRQFLGLIISALALTQLSSSNAIAQTPSSVSQNSPVSETTVTRLPVSDFTKDDDFASIKISPDGEHAAFLTGKHGSGVIAFVSIKDMKFTGSVKCVDNLEFYDFQWVSNRRIIYQMATRQASGLLAFTGEIFAIDYDNKNKNFIYGFRAGLDQSATHARPLQSSNASAEIVSPLLGDEKNILINETPWREIGNAYRPDRDAKPVIYLLDVYTGQKRRVESTPLVGADVLVDQQDRIRFAIGRNSELKIAASWKPNPDQGWKDFDFPGFREGTVIPSFISEDGHVVYFTGVKSESSFSALYSLDLESKAITTVYDFGNANISEVISDLQGKHIIGVAADFDKPRIHWIDPNDPAVTLHRELERAFPQQMVSIVSKTNDGSKAIARIFSDTNPGDFFLIDTKTMHANHLRSSRAWIDRHLMRPREPFSLTARDGVQLHGYITLPAGTGPFSLVVLPHGGPHFVRNAWGFDGEAELLANRGYAVLQINYRGSGGFGDDFQELGYKEWGGKIQDDITDATLWAIDRKVAARDRICIFGSSFGGYAALEGVVREPTLYRCAVSFAGIYDLELMFSSADIPQSQMGRDYLEKVLGKDTALLRSRSPVYNADKIQAPVLLIHGKEDWRADFEQAKRMKAALEKNHKQFEWMALSGEGHGIQDEETRAEVQERTIAFLDKHLKPSGETIKLNH